MEYLEKSVDSFLELQRSYQTTKMEVLYHQVLAKLHYLFQDILLCEKEGHQKNDIMKLIAPIYVIHKKSPLCRRMQEWPRGYPGDYETIEYLCNGINKASYHTLEYCLEKYVLNSPISQQHIHKIKYQAWEILKVFMTSQNNPSVLSIACGSSRDLWLIKDLLKELPNGQIILNDIDKDALDFSFTRLKDLRNKLNLIQGNIIKVIKQLGKTQKFDLIVAGGLFDYLKDKHIKHLFNNIYPILNLGGKLFVTNIAQGNPYRPWIEYMGNWILIERTEEDFLRLITEAGLPTETISMKREETGLTLLIEITKC